MAAAFLLLSSHRDHATVGEKGALRTGYFSSLLCNPSTVVFLPAEGHDLSSRVSVKCECSDLDFPSGSDFKEFACDAGDLGSVPGLGKSLEEGMATHSSILAWKTPWREEPGRLQSMGLQSVLI